MVRRNGIAPGGRPWSSYASAHVIHGEGGWVPVRQDMRGPGPTMCGDKSFAKRESGGGEPLFPWQNFGMVS
jgi:hypothetical protein